MNNSVLISFYSKFADVDVNNNYIFNAGVFQTLKKSNNALISLYSFNAMNTFYTIQKNNNDVLMLILEGGGEVPCYIPEGFYTIQTLLVALTKLIQDNVWFAAQVAYDTLSGKLVFQTNEASIVFGINSEKSTCASVLGLGNEDYIFSSNFTCRHIVNLQAIQSLMVHVNVPVDNRTQGQNVAFLDAIPINVAPMQLISFQNILSHQSRCDNLGSTQEMIFAFVSEKGKAVKFDGEFQIILAVKFSDEYDGEIDLKSLLTKDEFFHQHLTPEQKREKEMLEFLDTVEWD